LEQLEQPTAGGDRVLHAQAHHGDHGAFLCLRCRASWPLEQHLLAWHRLYQQSHSLDLAELASFALNDAGQALPFHTPADEGGPAGSFVVEVVRSWNYERAGLPHWARTRLEGCNDLKRFFRDHGILLIGDWALLADSSQVQVRRAMELAGGSTDLSAEEAAVLHARYRPVYQKAKLIHRQRTHRQQGWEPDDAFLRELEPNQPIALTSTRLKTVAKALRSLISGQWVGSGPSKATENDQDLMETLADPRPSPMQALEIQEEQLNLGRQARQVLLEVGHAYLTAMVAAMPTAEREQQLCFWRHWLTGASSRRISECCGAPQARVSRRMKIEARAEEIGQAALERLIRIPDFQGIRTDADRIEAAARGLMNHLLNPEQEDGESPLRQMVRAVMEVSA